MDRAAEKLRRSQTPPLNTNVHRTLTDFRHIRQSRATCPQRRWPPHLHRGRVRAEELLPLAADDEAIIIPLRLHVTHCRHMEVSVRFNGEDAKRRFPPSATIARVHHWAARRAFHLTPRDAAEHVLQLQGSAKRPDRDVHIGTLAGGKICAVAFDLVPRKRVGG